MVTGFHFTRATSTADVRFKDSAHEGSTLWGPAFLQLFHIISRTYIWLELVPGATTQAPDQVHDLV